MYSIYNKLHLRPQNIQRTPNQMQAPRHKSLDSASFLFSTYFFSKFDRFFDTCFAGDCSLGVPLFPSGGVDRAEVWVWCFGDFEGFVYSGGAVFSFLVRSEDDVLWHRVMCEQSIR